MPRKSFTIQYKISVIEFALEFSAKKASSTFHIHPSMISRWIKQRHDFLSLHKKELTKRRLGSPGRKVSFPAQEILLNQFIQRARGQGFPVSYRKIQTEMKAICPSQFKASYGWLYGFLNRHNLSLRIITSKLKKSMITIKSDESRVIESYHQTNKRMINMDQTPVWMDAGSTGRTVEKRGCKNVHALVPDGNPREKYSVILACDSEGNKLAPAVIAKSTRKKPRLSLVNGVLVFNNPGTSMANSRIMSQWTKIILENEPGEKLLLLDSFKGHLTDEMKSACDKACVTRAIIPGGFTSKLQPLDLSRLKYI